jgi:hypothetical protein
MILVSAVCRPAGHKNSNEASGLTIKSGIEQNISLYEKRHRSDILTEIGKNKIIMLVEKRDGRRNSFDGHRFNISKASQGVKVPFMVLLLPYGAIHTRLSVSSISDGNPD